MTQMDLLKTAIVLDLGVTYKFWKMFVKEKVRAQAVWDLWQHRVLHGNDKLYQSVLNST